MSTVIKLNRNHRRGCVCLFCVQARKRWGCTQWMAYRGTEIVRLAKCLHCGWKANQHAACWNDDTTGIGASGACPMLGLTANGLQSETFGTYEHRFSSELTFDMEEL